MGKVFSGISTELGDWIARQHVFFVATAPNSEAGLINCSPKGLDTLRVFDERTVAYQDLTGSGIETVAHLRENGRIVIMFCAFEGPPRIVRLHGRAQVVMPGGDRWPDLVSRFPERLGTRSFIVASLTRVSDSCGYAVPLLEYRGDRDVLDRSCAKMGEEGLEKYRAEKNRRSIDGLPGLP